MFEREGLSLLNPPDQKPGLLTSIGAGIRGAAPGGAVQFQPTIQWFFGDKGSGEVDTANTYGATPTFTRATTATTFSRIDDPYLGLPGTVGNYASTPDSPAVDITGDIELRIKVALDDWTPSDVKYFISKAAVGAFAYDFFVDTSGAITFRNFPTQTPTTATSSVAVGAADGSTKWLKVTRNATTGDVKFYTSDDGETWAQLGATVSTAAGGQQNGNEALAIGAQPDGTDGIAGKVYSAEVRNGIDGAVVAKFDAKDAQTWNATSWTSGTGEVWTVNQSGSPAASLVQGEIVSVASGTPRSYYDPSTGVYLGYLAEGARTNILLESEALDDLVGGWAGVTRASISANFGLAPDGTTSADKLIEDGTAASTHFLGQTFSKAASAITYTVSVFAKADGRAWFALQATSGPASANAYFNVSTGVTGTVSGTYTSISSSIKEFPNGWYRCTMSYTTDTGVVDNLNLILAEADNDITYDGDGVSGVVFWGAQKEAAAFASSYIPTTTAAVVRNADVLTYPTTGWLNASAGTLFSESQCFNVSAAANKVPFSLNDNTTNESIRNDFASATPTFVVLDGGVEQAAPTSGAATANTTVKIASAYSANDFAISSNGGAVGTDVSGTLPTVTQASVGLVGSGSAFNFGPIRRVSYYNKRLPDGTLQILTAG